MEFTYDQLAAQLRCPEDRTPEIVEQHRSALEYLCEIAVEAEGDETP